MRILQQAMLRLLPGERRPFLGSRTHSGGHMPLIPMRRGGQKVQQLRAMSQPALRNVPSNARSQQYRRATSEITQRKGGQAQGRGLKRMYHETIPGCWDSTSFGALFSVSGIIFLHHSGPRERGMQPGAGGQAGD